MVRVGAASELIQREHFSVKEDGRDHSSAHGSVAAGHPFLCLGFACISVGPNNPLEEGVELTTAQGANTHSQGGGCARGPPMPTRAPACPSLGQSGLCSSAQGSQTLSGSCNSCVPGAVCSCVQVKITSADLFSVVYTTGRHNCQDPETVLSLTECAMNAFWTPGESHEVAMSIRPHGETVCFSVRPARRHTVRVTRRGESARGRRASRPRLPVHGHPLDASLFCVCLLCSSGGFRARPPVCGRHRPLALRGALESVSTRGALLNAGTARAWTMLAPCEVGARWWEGSSVSGFASHRSEAQACRAFTARNGCVVMTRKRPTAHPLLADVSVSACELCYRARRGDGKGNLLPPDCSPRGWGAAGLPVQTPGPLVPRPPCRLAALMPKAEWHKPLINLSLWDFVSDTSLVRKESPSRRFHSLVCCPTLGSRLSLSWWHNQA